MPEDHTDDERELLDLAYPYALGAVSEYERAEIADRLAATAGTHRRSSLGSSPTPTRRWPALVAPTRSHRRPN